MISDSDIEKYEALRNAWIRETAAHSSPTLRHQNRNYQEILKMGKPAISLILKDLRNGNGDWWFAALRELTGENPCYPEDAGLYDVLCQRWVEWGNKNEY